MGKNVNRVNRSANVWWVSRARIGTNVKDDKRLWQDNKASWTRM